jgi:hypothetical protein
MPRKETTGQKWDPVAMSNGEATSIRDVRKSVNPAEVEFSPLGVYATHFIVSFLRFFAQSRR